MVKIFSHSKRNDALTRGVGGGVRGIFGSRQMYSTSSFLIKDMEIDEVVRSLHTNAKI